MWLDNCNYEGVKNICLQVSKLKDILSFLWKYFSSWASKFSKSLFFIKQEQVNFSILVLSLDFLWLSAQLALTSQVMKGLRDGSWPRWGRRFLDPLQAAFHPHRGIDDAAVNAARCIWVADHYASLWSSHSWSPTGWEAVWTMQWSLGSLTTSQAGHRLSVWAVWQCPVWCGGQWHRSSTASIPLQFIPHWEKKMPPQPLWITEKVVGDMEGYKYLRVLIGNRMDWKSNPETTYKTCRLYFLKKGRSFNTCSKILEISFQSVVRTAFSLLCCGAVVS